MGAGVRGNNVRCTWYMLQKCVVFRSHVLRDVWGRGMGSDGVEVK